MVSPPPIHERIGDKPNLYKNRGIGSNQLNGDRRPIIAQTPMPTKLLLIFIGAGIGGVLRYLIAGWTQNLTINATLFPTGTLAVNLIGCLIIGFLATAFTGNTAPIRIDEPYRIAILVGILGGFTTFSSFCYETLELLKEREFMLAILNITISNLGGLAAVFFGWKIAQRIFGLS